MNRHVLILNRWTNSFAEYHRYLDHTEDRVAYLTTAAGRTPLDGELAEDIRVLDDLSDTAEVLAQTAELVELYGPFTHVLALSEFDLEPAGEIRRHFGIPGRGPEEVAAVRDKVVMKGLVAAAGLRVPDFRETPTAGLVREFAARHGYPFVLKPRAGADSQGVHVVRSEAQLDALLNEGGLADAQCEEFIDGALYQIDGVMRGGRLLTSRSWRCGGSCLDFATGTAFSSVANDDRDFEQRVTGFAERVCAALDLTDDVFHLEVFRAPRPSGDGDELVFLEIGARAGGGQVRVIWEEVYGVDLVAASARVQLGDDMTIAPMDLDGPVAGYLMMPEPPVRPAVVDAVTSLVGRVPALCSETLPPPGTVLSGNGGAVHTAGTFRYRAERSEQVEEAIRQTLAAYRLDWHPQGEQPADARGPATREAVHVVG
ncbi:ATP-grasp domain-containing protein [Streptomyces sp. OR43]|uniref:ATP-grasp domain-containing protein n=1 Tax=Streptomyces sp. or43 TaxID=2478957 RepID=UPI0011CD7B1E|nr:ATP-grasp domain-containing protein [Streptomyces sp. or43]TXS37359.1 ATP-grasp domain-containing protein [Streptomyces sp. or43]